MQDSESEPRPGRVLRHRHRDGEIAQVLDLAGSQIPLVVALEFSIPPDVVLVAPEHYWV